MKTRSPFLRQSLIVGLLSSMMLVAMAPQRAAAADELTVAYFLEWPMPFQYAKVEGMYEKELGVDIKWVAFDTGTATNVMLATSATASIVRND